MAAVVRHVGLAPHPGGELRMQNIAEPIGLAKIRSHIGAAFYNTAVSGVPFHAARQAYLRACGMKIGKNVALMRGATVIRPERIRIGDHCIIGFKELWPV